MRKGNEILCDSSTIKADTIAAQAKFFKEAANAGFPVDVIAAYTGLKPTTVKQWSNGTVMPIHALNSITRQCPAFPNEIASLLTAPGERVVHDAQPFESDPHDAALKAWDLVGEMLRAQHPNSPGQERVVHSELPRIKLVAAGAETRMGKVAAA